MACVDTTLSTAGAPAKSRFQRFQCILNDWDSINMYTNLMPVFSHSCVASLLLLFSFFVNEAAVLQCCNSNHLSTLAYSQSGKEL